MFDNALVVCFKAALQELCNDYGKSILFLYQTRFETYILLISNTKLSLVANIKSMIPTYCFSPELVIRFAELNFHLNFIRTLHRLNS